MLLAPECFTQAEFADAIGKVLHRLVFLTTCDFAVKLFFGQMGEKLLLNGQHAMPRMLLQHRFDFQYPDIEPALSYALTT
ncbi:DUF1731 domain-containing protein [Candidatus Coxiella mudrowiae]|uniref:DUF1731 domain-containing protein n=1 Tax=Candidatus Coxiella mudrowiae TaxID=2054173 RepID=UPI0006622C8A|nr:DUF1731 domain-containing protein [Candidatus Coxiella mudrowiae]